MFIQVLASRPSIHCDHLLLLSVYSCLSQIDRFLVSWLHCSLPMGTIDFATLTILMGPATDAPHLLLEFPISGGTKVTTVMDLLPRKDLASDVEYLKRVYGDTLMTTLHNQVSLTTFFSSQSCIPICIPLGSHWAQLMYLMTLIILTAWSGRNIYFTKSHACLRLILRVSYHASDENITCSYSLLIPFLVWQCERDTRMKRYIPPSLYIRCATSPTSLLYVVDPSQWLEDKGGALKDGGKEVSFDSAIKDVVHGIARQFVQTWIDIVGNAREVEEGKAREILAARDEVVRRNGIEFDLTSNLPRLFGEEITNNVVNAFRDGR